MAGLIHTGAHDGDIEHLTVRCHPASGALQGVFYNSHRSRDGQWVAAAGVPRDADGRILAYVAKHGHGVYPSPGRVLRHVFLGNDLCSGAGLAWRPRRVVLLPLADAPGGDGQRFVQPRLASPVRPAPDLACGLGELRRRRLARAASRGSLLPPPGNGADSGNAVACASSGDSRGSIEVITDDPCEWFWFRGDWGQTPAPCVQSWCHTAETPVSRSSLHRIFLHFVRETESV